MHAPVESPEVRESSLRRFFGVFRYSRRAVGLVWSTNRRLTLLLAFATLVAGVLPAAAAYAGRLIVDAVVVGIDTARGGEPELTPVLRYVGLEALIVVLIAGAARLIQVCQSLLRAQLSQRVNVMVLEKALTLELRQFEDSEFYDRLTRARREASTRPLSLVIKTFGLGQNGVSLISYAVLLVQLSPWAVVVLVLAGLPAFIAETKFSGDAFRLFRWRSPETRRQMYLETVLAREDYAKEVQINRVGPLFLERYRDIFRQLYAEDRRLTLRRGGWGYALGLLSSAAFYGAYGWIAVTTVRGEISLGEMTMYLLLFRQGQAAVAASLSAIGGMYEDNLYLSNLYEYLEQPVPAAVGAARSGPAPGSGLRFERVSFTYPGSREPAVREVSFDLHPGESLALVGENGSGKTTVVKLLTRLYRPDSGRILLDGLDLQEWDEEALRRRLGVIFQDFSRYQLLAGENVGVGDVDHFDDEARWRQAARRGMAAGFIESLPKGYHTQLGRWFADGQELSGGQWQKVALSRALMRSEATVFVLDEPTASMDAAAEAQVFEHVRGLTAEKMAILISHRFSTVRMADRILVLERGAVLEAGNHAELVASGGRYAHLFSLQAAGYQ